MSFNVYEKIKKDALAKKTSDRKRYKETTSDREH